jgi:hypothetical protein
LAVDSQPRFEIFEILKSDVFIADRRDYRIRKVSTTEIAIVAGNGTGTFLAPSHSSILAVGCDRP